MAISLERIDAVAHVILTDLDDPKLDDETIHHLLRVLRIRDGEPISITDGEGNWRIAHASIVGKDGLELLLEGEVRFEPAPEHPVGIAFAPLRRSATSQLIQQCTEVGVSDLYPIITAFTNTDSDSLRTDRLERVAREAVMQSRRVWIPRVHPPTAWANFVSKYPDVVRADFQGERGKITDTTIIAIGPEGGWRNDERESALKTIRLGNEVMRAETAAVVATATLISARNN